MAAPNDVEIIRVYTREVGGSTADYTFRYDGQYEVVVEAEAGTAILTGGASYVIGINVRNLSDSRISIHNDEVSGHLNDPSWPNEAKEQVFGPIPPGPIPPPGQQGAHIYEVLAYVRVRDADPDVSFTKSPMYIVYTYDRP